MRTCLARRRVGGAIIIMVAVALAGGPATAATWEAGADNNPDLHTTTLEVTLQPVAPPTPSVVVDLKCMDDGVWRARVPLGDGPLRLAPQDFAPRVVGKTDDLLRFVMAVSVTVTADGGPESAALPGKVRWLGDDGTVYPWERDPAPVEGKAGRSCWWPGLHRNNAGHFAWRYEPNGLLVDNVDFGQINRSWYWFKPGRQESFQLNFGVPGLSGGGLKAQATGDEGPAKTGLERLMTYQSQRDPCAADAVSADWTSLRWRRKLETEGGRRYDQELRYSTLACGIQVETDAPNFELSFQDADHTRGPAGIILPQGDGVRVLGPAEGLDPAAMTDNWLLLMAADGGPEIPVMLVFQRRPGSVEWAGDRVVLGREAGIGTLCIGSPFGVVPQAPEMLQSWREDPSQIPVAKLRRFARLLAGYPWSCEEQFRVKDGWVEIRDRVGFLPWEDDWQTSPERRAPLPPLVAYSIQRGYLPAECAPGLEDLGWPTKWGPYWVAEGEALTYRLPIPECRDYAALGMSAGPEVAALGKALDNSLSAQALQRLHVEKPAPGIFPHCAAHDMYAGAWRCANFLSPELREQMRRDAGVAILGALAPQNYRLRRDIVTGATYQTCTFAWGHRDSPNGEGMADVDYWQGLVLYGINTYAKYSGDWQALKPHWATIRSLASYWEALNSWALMGPGAREAGEMYHGDMATAGFAGLVGFRNLTRVLGTAYQRDLAQYLLARNAVPMVAKFGFLGYARTMDQQEARGGQPCIGFGELWTASFPGINPAVRDLGYGDLWWHTGCIGPQSSQPEAMDLLMERCPDDMAQWEAAVRAACPDEALLSHDEIRVPPHLLLRAYLGGAMLDNARDLGNRWRDGYLPRDAHVAAMIVAWDCPVRLVEWTPARILSARWEAATRCARIEVEAGRGGAAVSWDQMGTEAPVSLDGRAASVQRGAKHGGRTLVTLRVPAGRHEIRVEMRSGRSGN